MSGVLLMPSTNQDQTVKPAQFVPNVRLDHTLGTYQHRGSVEVKRLEWTIT